MQATEANFLAELERVVRGERPTVDPRALLFVAAEVILEGRKADERDLQRIRNANAPYVTHRSRSLGSATKE
jgi:hypothetical protein